jgi:hypothetical protein
MPSVAYERAIHPSHRAEVAQVDSRNLKKAPVGNFASACRLEPEAGHETAEPDKT